MKEKKKVLLICGSNNQTTMMHEVGKHLNDFDCYYTPYYCDGFLKALYKANLLNFTVIGRHHQNRAIEYCSNHGLKIDFEGNANYYDLVITSSDLVIQKNIRGKKIVLVQEGMTDPVNIFYYASRYLGLPRYLASTSTAGLSHAYKLFCVASQGYAEHFISHGVDPRKLCVTGIPNFDNVDTYLNNDFPFSRYVLAATSDARETFKYENRKRTIYNALDIADGRQLIFKLHPNENFRRAEKEINKYAPEAMIYTAGNTNHMIANSDVLITKFSSVVYVGMALGKEVYSDFPVEKLRKMMPIQNGGTSGSRIADMCISVLEEKSFRSVYDSSFASGYKTYEEEYQASVTGDAA
ncbi:MAG: hypothetical protein IAE90_08980 [Ignavibacteria bacterium]|nr:hypothetical protein [Ignavibacteria bacterium]